VSAPAPLLAPRRARERECSRGPHAALLPARAEHGIDDEFASLVKEMAQAKENEEYVKWLGDLHGFVGGKSQRK
jgi:hypothetical protein